MRTWTRPSQDTDIVRADCRTRGYGQGESEWGGPYPSGAPCGRRVAKFWPTRVTCPHLSSFQNVIPDIRVPVTAFNCFLVQTLFSLHFFDQFYSSKKRKMLSMRIKFSFVSRRVEFHLICGRMAVACTMMKKCQLIFRFHLIRFCNQRNF